MIPREASHGCDDISAAVTLNWQRYGGNYHGRLVSIEHDAGSAHRAQDRCYAGSVSWAMLHH